MHRHLNVINIYTSHCAETASWNKHCCNVTYRNGAHDNTIWVPCIAPGGAVPCIAPPGAVPCIAPGGAVPCIAPPGAALVWRWELHLVATNMKRKSIPRQTNKQSALCRRTVRQQLYAWYCVRQHTRTRKGSVCTSKETLTNKLSPRDKALLEKLSAPRLLILTALYRTWRFITEFTKARHSSVQWAR